MGGDSTAYREEVLRLTGEGEQCYERGDLAGAIVRYQRACDLVRDSTGTPPGGADDAQQLGSMLYTLGEWLLEARDHQAAVDALVEAEAAYQTLGAGAAQLVADVVIRRARVHTAGAWPLSAIADAQQAVTDCLALAAADPQASLPVARVMAWAGEVQLAIGGDPDLAVSAADWALRVYLRQFRSGDRFMLPAVHAPAVLVAAKVAYRVHTSAGRGDLADTARWFFEVASEGAPLPASDPVEQPTLARTLETAGRRDLVATLTAPATDVRILVPAMRCSAQVAPAHARTLGDLMIAAPQEDELLLGLESHALFAEASRQQVLSMRYKFGEFGRWWGSAVVNFGQRYLEFGGISPALDVARWLSGIVGQLLPHAMADSRVRTDVLAFSRWQHNLYTATGDTEAAAGVGSVIAMLGGSAGVAADSD